MAVKRPGAYIREAESNVPATITDAIKNVGIIGKGSNYYAVNNVGLLRGEGTTDFIGVVGATNIVMQDGYRLDQDFTFDSSTGIITWTENNPKPGVGSVYYLNYKLEKTSEYYDPFTCYDLQEVIDIAGEEIEDGVINEITLASKIAFNNGANKVTFVQQNGDTDSAWETALNKLEDVKVNVLVAPGATTTALQNKILNHVTKMSSYTNRSERIAFVNPISDNIGGIVSEAEGLASDRMVKMFPNNVEVKLADSYGNEDTYKVNATYLGAAIAGKMANVDNDEATPITYSTVAGFNNLDGKFYSDAKYNQLTAGGVCCIFDDKGTLRVNQAVTTNTSSVDKIELSVRNIKDTIQYQVRELMEKNFVGKKLFIDEIVPKAKSLLKSFCEQKVNAQVFNPKNGDAGYGDIQIAQDDNDPRTLLVSFKFRPTFTLTWCEISYRVSV